MRCPNLRSMALASALSLAGAFAVTSAVAAETLRMVAFTPKNDAVLVMANDWVNLINSKLGDQVKINFVGGPEVIGRYQQVEALRNGVVDMLIASTADYQDQIPTASAFVLSRLRPSEERQSGFYDYMVEEHAKRLNTRYIGRVQASPFYLWMKKEPKSLSDLQGVKMRTGSLYDKFMQALGMVPVTINSPEVYTALQSGVVDGFGWPVTGPLTRGWLESVKNVIDLPFFGASNLLALMNLDKWNKLPEATRNEMIRLTAEFEPRMIEYFDAQNEKEWTAIGDKVKRVKFSEAENKKYLDTAYEVEWDTMAKRVSPDELARVRKMTGN
jgi:TRAP-type C4-dicarboxylate transport system substrate-binding protein